MFRIAILATALAAGAAAAFPAQPYPAYSPHQTQAGYAGYPVHPGYRPYAQPGTNGMGVAGFVTGLLGLILFFFPVVGQILAVLGIVFGSIGISTGKRNGQSTGLAIAGLVLGIVSIALLLLVVAV